MDSFRRQGWAESTKRVYRSQLKCYMTFCDSMSLVPVPISTDGISLYIAYLATVKSFHFQTITNYLVIVKHLHLSCGFKDPVKDNWHVQHLLQGVKRVIGNAQTGAVPLTPDMLLSIKGQLKLYRLLDLSVWCACLIGFYGMLRPGNFLYKDPHVPLLRICQISSNNLDYVIKFEYSKTIQFREKQLCVVIPYIENHPLCPASALYSLLSLHLLLGSNGQSALLCESVVKVLSYDKFLSFVNNLLSKAGYSCKLTGHSFRRGGATWAFNAGLSGEAIQDIGMWQSDAYLRYIEHSLQSKCNAMKEFGHNLPKQRLLQ